MEPLSLKSMSIDQIVDAIVKNHDLKIDIAVNMKDRGGSFVQALAMCALTADEYNLRRLVEAFYDYFVEYNK